MPGEWRLRRGESLAARERRRRRRRRSGAATTRQHHKPLNSKTLEKNLNFEFSGIPGFGIGLAACLLQTTFCHDFEQHFEPSRGGRADASLPSKGTSRDRFFATGSLEL
jgi:hypothetical protein